MALGENGRAGEEARGDVVALPAEHELEARVRGGAEDRRPHGPRRSAALEQHPRRAAAVRVDAQASRRVRARALRERLALRGPSRESPVREAPELLLDAPRAHFLAG